ncbi:MAG: hypothetical protein KC657_11080, partial [Myxococcales bacterium]|nr:hypothetical protein [Myxococcales bacterium]
AFSVALWEALYGERPFSPSAQGGLLAAIAEGPPTRTAAHDGEAVPETVRRALVRGLSFRRRDRPASMDALLAALAVDAPPARGAWTRGAL